MSQEAKLREQLWYGVPFKQALQDVIARNNTGYSYAELQEAVKSGEDLLEDDEVESVDKTVNILMHMFVFYHSHSPENAPAAQLEGSDHDA